MIFINTLPYKKGMHNQVDHTFLYLRYNYFVIILHFYQHPCIKILKAAVPLYDKYTAAHLPVFHNDRLLFLPGQIHLLSSHTPASSAFRNKESFPCAVSFTLPSSSTISICFNTARQTNWQKFHSPPEKPELLHMDPIVFLELQIRIILLIYRIVFLLSSQLLSQKVILLFLWGTETGTWDTHNTDKSLAEE